MHATKEARQRLKYMIKLFKELNLLSMVKDVEINDSQPKLETGSSKLEHFEVELCWIQDEVQVRKVA